jgi:small subunit ribosomal protein S19e
MGVERMRSFYGGNKNRGSRPNAFRKGSGSVLRKSVQQLEAAGLVIHDKTGRRVSPEGMKFLDNLSHEVSKNPPAPVPKRVKPVVEEPKKADGKKEGKKKGGAKEPAAEGADGVKAEKKTAKKKAEKAEAPQ